MRKLVNRLPAEWVVVAIVLVALVCGSEIVRMAEGWPSADDRLIVAASGSDQAAFDAAMRDGASVRARDCQGTTALMMAAASGSVSRTERLLALGADVNATDAPNGRTALMLAAQNDRAAVLRLLLHAGADPALRDRAGMSALDLARFFEARETDAILEGVNGR